MAAQAETAEMAVPTVGAELEGARGELTAATETVAVLKAVAWEGASMVVLAVLAGVEAVRWAKVAMRAADREMSE